jgi:hypothetical protein
MWGEDPQGSVVESAVGCVEVCAGSALRCVELPEQALDCTQVVLSQPGFGDILVDVVGWSWRRTSSRVPKAANNSPSLSGTKTGRDARSDIEGVTFISNGRDGDRIWLRFPYGAPVQPFGDVA